MDDLLAQAKRIKTRSQRVRWIAGLMSRLQWPQQPNGYEFRLALAKAWKLKESAVKAYAAEASRNLQWEADDLPELRRSLSQRCAELALDASTRTSSVTGMPDYGSALKAIEMHARFAGVEVDTKTVKVDASIQGLAELLAAGFSETAGKSVEE